MDFCIDKDITQITTFNKLMSYLYTKTNFEPEIVYFVVKEQNEGYLIQNQNDFDTMQSICRQNEDYYPRFIVKNVNMKNFKILEEKGNCIGESLTVNSIFKRTWIVEIVGNYTIDQIIAEKDLGKFSIQQIDQKQYQIDFSATILDSQEYREVNFTARAFNNSASSEFGPLLWIYFKSSL